MDAHCKGCFSCGKPYHYAAKRVMFDGTNVGTLLAQGIFKLGQRLAVIRKIGEAFEFVQVGHYK